MLIICVTKSKMRFQSIDFDEMAIIGVSIYLSKGVSLFLSAIGQKPSNTKIAILYPPITAISEA